MPLLAERVRQALPRDSVIVAPDLGAAKLAERYARILDLPVAFVHKRRITATEVAVHLSPAMSPAGRRSSSMT